MLKLCLVIELELGLGLSDSTTSLQK